MGEAGVDKVLEIIHRELDLTMAFTGHTQLRGSTAPSCCPAASEAILGTSRR